jgi:hypothetical protein
MRALGRSEGAEIFAMGRPGVPPDMPSRRTRAAVEHDVSHCPRHRQSGGLVGRAVRRRRAASAERCIDSRRTVSSLRETHFPGLVRADSSVGAVPAGGGVYPGHNLSQRGGVLHDRHTFNLTNAVQID